MNNGLLKRQWVPIAIGRYQGAVEGMTFRRLPNSPMGMDDAKRLHKSGALYMAQRRIGPPEDMKHEQLVWVK